MGGGKGVVDIDVAELGELVDIGRIVLLLALVEAGVLEQEHVAVLHFGDRVVGDLPMQSAAKATGRLMTSATAAATGLSELASSGPPLGRPKWARRMTLPPLSAISADRRRDPLDAGRVGHAAVLRRHVEIDAQQHALAGDIGVVEGAEWFAHVSASERLAQKSGLPDPSAQVVNTIPSIVQVEGSALNRPSTPESRRLELGDLDLNLLQLGLLRARRENFGDLGFEALKNSAPSRATRIGPSGPDGDPLPGPRPGGR